MLSPAPAPWHCGAEVPALTAAQRSPYSTTQQSELSAYIERLTVRLVSAQCNIETPEEFAFVRSVTAARVRVHYRDGSICGGLFATYTVDEHLAATVAWRQQWYDWRMHAWNATAEVLPRGRRAVSWVTMCGNRSGVVDLTRLEYVHKYHWVRMEADWVWYRVDAISSSPGIRGVYSA
jgi:hypothetical protein